MSFQSKIVTLEKIINSFPNKVSRFTEEEWLKKETPEKWSKQEVLSHLVDSAIHNLQRLVLIQFQNEPYVVYAQNDWVKGQHWQKASIAEVMSLWKGINTQILNIWKNFPQEIKTNQFGVSNKKKVKVSFLEMVDDYIGHFHHHEKQIFPSMITIIAAIANNNALGKDNDLIWHIPADLKRFKKVTTGHHILMGRNTFESIGKPLPNRTTVIITRNNDYFKDGCLVANSIEEAIEIAKEDTDIYIIGGAQIYKQAMENSLVDKLDITHVHHEFEADVFFPEIDASVWELSSKEDFKADDKNKYNYSFVSYTRK